MAPARTVIASALALALASAGCGGDDSSGDGQDEVVAGSWSGPQPSARVMSPVDSAAIDDAAEQALRRSGGGTPGLWLDVRDPRKGSYAAGYGVAAEPDTAARAADHSRVGELTMTFTAAAVLEQVDRGKLALDDTVADVLPGLAEVHPEVGAVTVEELLGMTSGVPDYLDSGLVLNDAIADTEKVWAGEEIVKRVLTETALQPAGTPGYSATGYLILGEMLEAVTGEPAEDVLDAVAEEAGLEQTALPSPSEEELPDPHSEGYINEPGVASLGKQGVVGPAPGAEVTDWSPSWGATAAGIYSTVEDLGDWAATGFGNRLLGEALGKRRLRAQRIPGTGRYGLGIVDYGNGWIGHSGRALGWEAVALYNRRTGAVVAAIVNEAGSLPTAAAAIRELHPELGSAFN